MLGYSWWLAGQAEQGRQTGMARRAAAALGSLGCRLRAPAAAGTCSQQVGLLGNSC